MFAAPARAATPVAPASGSSFTTTDTATFTAQPAPDEGDYTFVVAATNQFYNAGYVFSAGPDGDDLELDMGWLATKFDHLGTYWWGVCPVGPDLEIVVAECSPPWTFSVRFRLADLPGWQARGDTHWVMAQNSGPSGAGFPGARCPARA